jgi:cell division protein FtsZ
MDFNGISNNQESNEEKAGSQSPNNSSSNSSNGFPKRWNFKEVMKQEETPKASLPVTQSTAETSGDPEFDKQWAEMLAKEEADESAKFIAENQITPAVEAKIETETPVQSKPKVELPKFRSVADIMKGFGNIGGENEEDYDYSKEETKVSVAETPITPISEIVTEPVNEVSAVEDVAPVVEVIAETQVTVEEIAPIAEVEIVTEAVVETPVTVEEIEPIAEVATEVEAVTVEPVIVEEIAPVAETIVETPIAVAEEVVDVAPTVEEESELQWTNVQPIEVVAEVPVAEIPSVVEETESWSEPVAWTNVVDEEVPEISDEAVAELSSMGTTEIDFADIIEQNSTLSPAAELTPEVISETLEAIGLEPAFEINMSPVADSAEEVMMSIANDTNLDSANEIMSESDNSLFNEDFEPIELAGDNTPLAETPAPVFVNVEHAWMYTVEPVAPVDEIESVNEPANFNTSMPGELPLFESESSATINLETETHTHNNPKSEEAMKFELPEYSSIIKVIGVGGGGSNAVNHMYKLGIKGVDFLVCNTDKQALDLSPVPHKVVLGTTLTEGRGAGSIPEVGRNAAIENIEDLRSILSNNTKMVFITAGMGGGTGTGAAPVIAGVARELGILTVGIVTVPFAHEGKKRRQYAEEGIELLKQNVDTLLVIRNDKLREMYGNLKLSDAFAHADDVLTTAAKSIAEIISITQQINVDFADICTVMRNSGVAIMGSAVASGENRAVRAVEMSLNSPLLNDNNIIGARYVLLNIISGSDEITMDELGEITDFIQEAAGQTAEIIKGYGVDPELGDSVSVTIIATGFQQTNPVNYEYAPKSQPEKVVRQLEEKIVEAPKAEVIPTPVAETDVNPLEPFLVSKPVEPVAEVKPVIETKTEWTSPSSVEFEIVNTSQEIVEPVSEITSEDIIETPSVTEFTSSIEESFSEEITEPTLIVKEEIKAELNSEEAAKKAEQEEIQRRANERIQKLRDISLKLKSPQVLNEMENEPAYKRRNVNLENVPHSSESQVSRFTLTENEEKKIEIRPNNSFLHDNVD